MTQNLINYDSCNNINDKSKRKLLNNSVINSKSNILLKSNSKTLSNRDIFDVSQSMQFKKDDNYYTLENTSNAKLFWSKVKLQDNSCQPIAREGTTLINIKKSL